MHELVADFETFWDTKNKYSLRVCKTADYVRDPRFAAHGAAVSLDGAPTQWLRGEELEEYFAQIDWEDTILICHNTYFDGFILFHHYGHIPARYVCTLSMGRALFPYLVGGHSLDNLARSLGVPGKIEGLRATNGLYWDEMGKALQNVLVEYAINDTTITAQVYRKLVAAFPDDELELLNITLKWACVPTVHVDTEHAKSALEAHLESRDETIRRGGVKRTILSSNPQFAKYVQEELGLEPPTKLNKHGDVTWAFSKSDLQFQDFMTDHPEYEHIWEARLAIKSTIMSTRLESLIKIGKAGPLPMPLKYCGAHTLRWSGSDGINPQNWPKKGAIRECIVPPPGYKILVYDQAQIELRINFWFCGELDALRIAHESDIYIDFASSHFGVPFDEVDAGQRFFGKTCQLGLGYGMGWKKFRRQCASSNYQKIYLSEREAFNVVRSYRTKYARIPRMWRILDSCIMNMYTGQERQLGPIRFVKNGIQVPGGMTLDYPNLEPTEDNGWRYGKPGKWKYTWGGALLENIIQCLARLVIGQNILDATRELDYVHLFTSTHDEVGALVRSTKVEEADAAVAEIMSRSPWWAPELPLVGEGEYGDCYVKN